MLDSRNPAVEISCDALSQDKNLVTSRCFDNQGSLLVKNPLKAPEFQNAPHNVLRSTEMGAAQSQLKKEELEKLQEHSHFQQKELKAMYKQFRKEQPQGYIDKEEFREMMRQMGVVDSFLQDLIFNVFDEDKDGGINFQEFVAALSVMTRGDPTEKLEFAFNMYDIDGDGVIDKREMGQIMESFYKLVGPLVTFSGKKYESPSQLVEEFFDIMDKNGDGKITLEEYKEGALKNPDVIQGLKLFS
ncbi:calcium-binding protein [Planoprotostelium fungivorum]|uniref:Calcium-binding protein n=1 Tax=Planoprotostelium fungivorum TaxID=1890364 RepID=A0A2P6N817_9EUKA|nr:calcium-binding protein [Planoprotostelium fungivorum]